MPRALRSRRNATISTHHRAADGKRHGEERAFCPYTPVFMPLARMRMPRDDDAAPPRHSITLYLIEQIRLIDIALSGPRRCMHFISSTIPARQQFHFSMGYVLDATCFRRCQTYTRLTTIALNLNYLIFIIPQFTAQNATDLISSLFLPFNIKSIYKGLRRFSLINTRLQYSNIIMPVGQLFSDALSKSTNTPSFKTFPFT